MRTQTVILTLGVLLALALSATAQTPNYIPRDTVIPVILDNTLSSVTAVVGQRFFAHCAGPNCAGFPAGTSFTGQVTSVTRSYGRTPGQIGVQFIQAQLPNGTIVPINGSLTSLHSNDVRYNPNTGLFTATGNARRLNSKFIGYGAGAGFLIGALTRGNILVGTVVGAALGYLYGNTIGRTTRVSDVTVPAGTQFGIMLNSRAGFPGTVGAGPGYYPPPTPAPGPVAGPGPYTVIYTNIRPFVSQNGVLMVPLRHTLNSIEMPFTFRAQNRRVIIDTYNGEVIHPIGTNFVYINGQTRYLEAPSRNVGGKLYVPADLIGIATGMTPYWNAYSRTLTLR